MDGPFVFDDHPSIVENRSIRSLRPLNRSMFSERDTPTAGRPLANFSFAVNYAIGGMNTRGYHVTNVLLHILNATILFALIFRTLREPPWTERWNAGAGRIAFVAAMLWALHPLQTEAVSYVSQRTELLMAFFFLATLYFSRLAWDAKHSRTKLVWQFGCVLCCGFGMASKEVMVVAPVIVVLYDFAILKQPLVVLVKCRGWLYLALAMTWGILGALLASRPRGLSAGFGLSVTPIVYMQTQLWAITKYLRLAAWPVGLCADYGVFSISSRNTWLPCLVIVLALMSIVLWGWFRCRSLAFLGIWFFLILAPSSSFVPIVTEPVAERRMYLPLAGLIVSVVVVVAVALRRLMATDFYSQHKIRILFQSVIGIAAFGTVVVYGIATYERNRVYQSALAFWTDVVHKRPGNARGFTNLGIAYLNENKMELSKNSFEQAISLDGSDANAHYNFAKWFETKGDIEHALAEHNIAIALNPSMFDSLYNRGVLMERCGELDKAMLDYQAAIKVNPNLAVAHLNMGSLYFSQGQHQLAIEKYRETLRIDPQSSLALSNLGGVYAEHGDFENAIPLLERATKIQPDKLDAWYNLGQSYASSMRYVEAIAAFEKCVSIQPTDSEAWLRLAKLYIVAQRSVDAERCMKKVRELKPDSNQGVEEMLKEFVPLLEKDRF